MSAYSLTHRSTFPPQQDDGGDIRSVSAPHAASSTLHHAGSVVMVTASKCPAGGWQVDVAVDRRTGERRIVAVAHVVEARTADDAVAAGLQMGRDAVDGR